MDNSSLLQTKIELEQYRKDNIQLRSHNSLLEDEIDSMEAQLAHANTFAWTFFLLFWFAIGFLIFKHYPNELHMVLNAFEDLLEHLFK